MAKFEGGQLVQLILTKVVFACQRLWWRRRLGLHGDLRPAGLGLVAPIWKPLPDASGLLTCACPFSTKEETRTLRVGARLAPVVMACVTQTSRGVPFLDLSAPCEPAW